jgi:hypothetical protein
MKDYNQLKAEMMSRTRLGRSRPRPSSRYHRQAADQLTAEANQGISNFQPRPTFMDYVRGVDDFGINRALL